MVCALSDYAYEVVDKRRQKTSSHLEKVESRGLLLSFHSLMFLCWEIQLSPRTAAEHRKQQNEFVAFN